MIYIISIKLSRALQSYGLSFRYQWISLYLMMCSWCSSIWFSPWSWWRMGWNQPKQWKLKYPAKKVFVMKITLFASIVLNTVSKLMISRQSLMANVCWAPDSKNNQAEMMSHIQGIPMITDSFSTIQNCFVFPSPELKCELDDNKQNRL